MRVINIQMFNFKTDSSEIVPQKEQIGQTEAQFKDRTVVDALNANVV